MAARSTLARYRHISTLGSGGMATVVLAEDTVLGRRVALKRMIATGDAQGLLRLRREALVGASVSHPNLVPVYDVITLEEGEHVIVMEYVQGETLRDALTREGRFEPTAALRILAGVGAALDAIHRQGIVHRDVKPPNILLGLDGTVKLADLGIASVPDRTQITTSGAVLGSFRYMAPEQLEDAPATPAIDVYALAAVAFEVLSGRQARPEPNPVALAYAISSQPPPDLREVWPEAPARAAELVRRGMAHDPADRPRSAGELVARLRETVEPEVIAPRAARPPVPAPKPARREVAAVPLAPQSPPRRSRPQPPQGPEPSAEPGAQEAAAQEAAAQEAAAHEAPARDALASDAPLRDRGPRPVTPAPRARGREPSPAPEVRMAPRRSERSRRPLVAGLLALAAVAAVAIALVAALGAGGSPSAGQGNASTTNHGSAPAGAGASRTSTSAHASASASASTAGSGSASAAAANSSAAAPVKAVESFYQLAAAHRYSEAWALADPTFQAQLQGYGSFQAGQSGDKSIRFNSARVVSQTPGAATVAISTTSVRTDGTQQCSGTVDTRPGGSSGGWLVHMIHINCA